MGIKSATLNPAENNLRAGVKDQDLEEAVGSSGYPLQTVVGRILQKDFGVQQEWSFLDPDEHVVRSMDLFAEKALYKVTGPQPRVRPTLNLIVECKRSDLPYVFFISDVPVATPRFPLIAGLKTAAVDISTDDDRSHWLFSPREALALDEHDFVKTQALHAATFSRCERQGAKLRLSGNETFNGIVHPMIKAIEHFQRVEAPPPSAVYFDAHCVLPVVVLDAPMVGVRVGPTGQTELEFVPWLRVPRHHGHDLSGLDHRKNVFAIDVVHVGFLETYLDECVRPFATEFGVRVLRHQTELAEMEGFVPRMGTEWHRIVEPLLVPLPSRSRRKRPREESKKASARPGPASAKRRLTRR